VSNETDDIYRVMDEAEIWEFLENNSFGRLAFAVQNVPEIVPINYVAADRKLYFRTASGSKLLGLTINASVAFETDEVGDGRARSVILSGAARELQTSAEMEWAETLPLHPWVPTLKYRFIEITPDEVSGRDFRLGEDPER
jgi:uncharacterized protein